MTTPPPLREMIAEYGLRADKSFGQHFLLDLNLTGKIASLCGDVSDATLIEVGPGPGGLTPGMLAATLGLPPSSLSFHLKELVQAGLVGVERQSRHLHYRPAVGHMNALLAYLTAHCCHGEPCGLVTSSPSNCC